MTDAERNELRVAKKEAIIKSLKNGCDVTSACKAAKASKVSFYKWRTDDKDFDRQVVSAQSIRIEIIKDVAYANALKSETDPQYQRTLLAWLQAHAPEEWGKRINLKRLDELTDEEIDARIRSYETKLLGETGVSRAEDHKGSEIYSGAEIGNGMAE